MEKAEKYSAALLGCAIGDALGMPVEGWKREQIMKYVGRITGLIGPVIVRDENGEVVYQDEHGPLKYWTKAFKKGDYTDDTILTLALAESIVKMKGVDIADIAQRQLREYVLRKREDGTVSGGFGSTTTAAFKNLENGLSPYESGVIGGPGNAPAMKMSPAGLYMDATGRYEEGLKAAEAIGRITHLDPRSVASGVVQAHAVYALLKGTDREEFLKSAVEVCREHEKPLTRDFAFHKKGNLLSRLEWIFNNKDNSAEEAYNVLGASSVVYRSYPFALFMFQKYWDNPVDGLIETVNYGGDCDTTGAIYGALAGAKNGMAFPEEWIKELKDADKISGLGKEICNLGSD